MRGIIMMACCLWIVSPAWAAESRLDTAQVERVRASSGLVEEANLKTFAQTLADIERSPYPEGQVQILEAIAKTYAELKSAYSVEEPARKEWLYSMILLNMAYFQLGGQDTDDGSHLNRLIQQKLKEHLPPDLLTRPDLFKSLE